MDNKLSWKESVLNKKMLFVFLQIVGAVIFILMNVESRIEVQVGEEVTETVQNAMAPGFEQVNNKIDEMNGRLVKIEKRMDQEEIQDVIITIEKQGKKIREKNWSDIHDPDIKKAVAGYAKLQDQKYDPGILAQLKPDIDLISLYHSGQIGPD